MIHNMREEMYRNSKMAKEFLSNLTKRVNVTVKSAEKHKFI